MTWMCMSCTLENQDDSQACELCETAKPKSFRIRFRTASQIFTLELHPTTTVAEMKVLIESRINLAMAQQRLYYGQPRRELFGKDSLPVSQVLSIKNDELFQITIEERSLMSPTAASSAAAADSNGRGSPHRADTDEDMASVAGSVAGAGAGLAHGGDMENDFIAYLSPRGHEAAAAAAAAASAASAATAAPAPSTDDEFGEDDGGAGDWGDEGSGGDNDFFEDEHEMEEETMKAKQIREEEEAAKAKKQRQSSAHNTRLGEYKCLTLHQLHDAMKQQLHELQDAIGCDMNEAAILMRAFAWKKERLFDAYLSDPHAVQKKCGLLRMGKEDGADAGATAAAAAASSTQLGDCLLCGDAMDQNSSIDLGCGHRFCKVCFSSWLVAALDKGPQALNTCCPAFKCTAVVPDDLFLDLLPEVKQKRLLSRWSLSHFVSAQPTLAWCVNPRCARVIKYTAGGARDVECDCGTRFCFACKLPESHSPCQCEMVAKWLAKSKSDDDNSTWLRANTKPCPGCKNNIEKNNGCNHMTCSTCKHQWCWLCRGDWSKHGSGSGGYYACNVYEAAKKEVGSTVSQEEASAEEARAKINRYQWYYERTTAYGQSIAAAEKQIHQTESRMELLQDLLGTDLSSLEFLLDANKSVIECRKALKWSYVIGFFLKEGSRQQQQFQIDQGQLERFSDDLHGLIELPIERLLPLPKDTNPPSPSKKAAAAVTTAAVTTAAGTTAAAHTPPKPVPSPAPTATAASATSNGTAPIAASAAAGASSPPQPANASAPMTLHGDQLRQHIEHKTSVANKFLSNLVEAAEGGLYVDLALQRLPSC